MNFVSHTRAAHERLTSQPDARPQHIALYWALFFQWNASHFAHEVELDHAATMQAARIGNERTYRAALYDLDTWALIAYHPSQSRYQPSRCKLTNLSGAEVPPMKVSTGGRSGPDEKASPGAEVPEALQAKVPPIKPSSGAEVPEDTLLGKTSFKTPLQNVGGGISKKIGEVFSGEGFSGVEVIDDPAAHDEPVPPAPDRPRAAPKEAANRAAGVAPKKKGVREATIRAAAEAQATGPARKPRGGRPNNAEVPFAESDLATYEAFAAAFAGTDFELADLRFYHAKVANWRPKGQLPYRTDWKATATQFFLNDAHDNRLKLAPGVQRHQPGANSSPADAGNAVPRYRSSRYDS